MKRITGLLLTLSLALCLTSSVYAAGPSKTQRRIAYTIKNLKLSTEQQKALQPILTAYCADLKAAKKKYDDLKAKYAINIDKGLLTDNAGQQLLAAKFDSDVHELEVRKAYAKKFAAVLPPKKVYLCFTLINDKMSKVDGLKTGGKNDEE